MSHFLELRRQYYQARADQSKVAQTSKSTGGVASDKFSRHTELRILDKSTNTVVTMQCPDMEILQFHSKRIAEIVKERKSLSTESEAPVFPGFYHIWQEIFSHMIDDYVMDKALLGCSVSELLDYYKYSCQFEIHHLCSRYVKELTSRISSESFLQMFHVSIGVFSDSFSIKDYSSRHPVDIHANITFQMISFCCSCLSFFIRKLGKLSSPQNIQRKTIMSEILEMVLAFLLKNMAT